VLFELWGTDSALYIGKAGESPSYALAKATTTYVEFQDRSTTGGIFINDVAGLTTTVGGSGFFAGSTSTPATEGAGLMVTYAGATTIDPCALSPELCKPPEPPVIIDPIIIIPSGDCSANPGSCAPKPDDTAGGDEGEFGSDGKSKGKRKAAQCKG
jgi:hypothetical protein